jgi:hypothetical protein
MGCSVFKDSRKDSSESTGTIGTNYLLETKSQDCYLIIAPVPTACGLATSPTDPKLWKMLMLMGLSTSVRRISNRACGLRLCGSNSGFAIDVRVDCLSLDRKGMLSEFNKPVVPL